MNGGIWGVNVTAGVVLTIILILIVGLTSIFAYSETAITSASKIKLNTIISNPKSSKKEKSQANRVLKFISNFNEYITAIVIIVNLLTILASSLMTILFGPSVFDPSIWWMYIIILILFTFFVLIFADLLPKMLAKRFPERGIMRFSWILSIVALILKPLTLTFSKLVKESEESIVSSDDEINAVLNEATESGVTTSFEQNLIKRTLMIDEMRLEQVMLPKENVITVPMNVTKTMINNLLKKNNLSRFPMLNDKGEVKAIFSSGKYLIDKVNGKTDSIKSYSYNFSKFNFDDNPFSVLETLRNKRERMGIVIDDDGIYAGVVTLEDILELMVGSIYDEDDIEKDGVYKLNSTSFIVEPRVKVEFFTKNYLPENIVIPSSYKNMTIRGFVKSLNKQRKLNVGDHFTYKDMIIWVKEDKYDGSKIIFEIDII